MSDHIFIPAHDTAGIWEQMDRFSTAILASALGAITCFRARSLLDALNRILEKYKQPDSELFRSDLLESSGIWHTVRSGCC